MAEPTTTESNVGAPEDRPVLYSVFLSSCSWRVRSVMALKGIDYEYRAAGSMLKSEEYGKLNPLPVIPTLVIDGHALCQSFAIVEYLEERYPTPSIYPIDPIQRQQARAIAQMIVSDIQPLQVPRVMASLGLDEAGEGPGLEFAQKWITFGFAGLERMLERTAGRYCVGDTLTFADMCLVAQVYNARRRKVDLSPYPHIVRIEALAATHPAIANGHPSQQPD